MWGQHSVKCSGAQSFSRAVPNRGEAHSPSESRLIPRPKRVSCTDSGVICENKDKNIRVGDYNGETFCNASGCHVWHGDGNAHGGGTPKPYLPLGSCGGADCKAVADSMEQFVEAQTMEAPRKGGREGLGASHVSRSKMAAF